MTSTWCLTRGLILSAALGAALVPLHGAAQQPAVPASGTPATLSPAAAAVVDIAGASGFIDVVGVKLGARLVDAITALRTYSPKMTFHAFAYQRYEALPKIDFGHTVMGRVRSPQYRQGYDDMEAVVMRVTLPPSPLLVWEVFRHVEWKHGTGPTSENVIAGLREKYGHETGTYLMDGPGPQLWWVYDRQGHHVATERIAQAVGPAATSAPPGSCSPSALGVAPEPDWSGFTREDALSWDDASLDVEQSKGGFVRSASGVYKGLLEQGFDQIPSEDAKARMGSFNLEKLLRAQTFCREISVVYVTLMRDSPLNQVYELNVSARMRRCGAEVRIHPDSGRWQS